MCEATTIMLDPFQPGAFYSWGRYKIKHGLHTQIFADKQPLGDVCLYCIKVGARMASRGGSVSFRWIKKDKKRMAQFKNDRVEYMRTLDRFHGGDEYNRTATKTSDV